MYAGRTCVAVSNVTAFSGHLMVLTMNSKRTCGDNLMTKVLQLVERLFHFLRDVITIHSLDIFP
jgi:hypothetical protein